jgi:hypothetical protein
MSWKDEQKGSSNHANMRDPRNLRNQEKAPSTHAGAQQAQGRPQGGKNADPYERNVPEPTNRSALGDQSSKR